MLPTFNRPELVLRSVKSVMNQKYENYKLIIFNDGSTKSYSDLENLIEGVDNIEYIKSHNVGVNKSRNIILDKIFSENFNISNSYFFTLSDDDYLSEDSLAIISESISKIKGIWYCFNCESLSGHLFKNSDFESYEVLSYNKFYNNYKGDKHFVFKLDAFKKIRYPEKFFKNGYEHIFYYQIPFNIQIIPKKVKVIEYYDDGLSLSDLYENKHTFRILIKQIRSAPNKFVFYKMLMKHIFLPKDIIKNLISKDKYYDLKRKLGLKVRDR
ncbi:glycosyltransferase family A protein [Acinetobacter indicus]|uniref:glycosyltransferase family A protein n=2 Tax=Acinetobacter indicus TaxID=756892 RepID=UPI000CECAD32|nr:glycosyltransferase family A protein [Acinetobacter indicus]